MIVGASTTYLRNLRNFQRLTTNDFKFAFFQVPTDVFFLY